MVMERTRTDCMCCLIFVAFIVVMIVISVYAVLTGDPRRILVPFDSAGNECGQPDQGTGKVDFTEYKYKYFAHVMNTATGTGDSKRKYDAVCVKACPKEIPELTSAAYLTQPKLDCLPNSVVDGCMRPNYNATVILAFCVPEFSSTIQSLNKIAVQMGGEDQLGSLLVDFQTAWAVVVIMSVISLVITILYVFLLRWIAKPVIYISIILIELLMIGGAVFLGMRSQDEMGPNPTDEQLNMQKGYIAGAIIILVLVLLSVVCLCCQWRNIKIGLAILQASSDFVSSNTRMIFLPLLTYLMMIVVWCVWLFFVVHLASIGTPSFKKDSYVSHMEYEKVITYIFLVMLFGVLWILAFMDAVEKFVIASTTCMWYFSGEGSDNTDRTGQTSMTLSIKWAFSYHLGTMAFGGFLIATMNMIKILFEYFAQQAEKSGQTTNPVVKVLICCTRCCIWCLDNCIRFINKNAYIQCALFSNPFCKSAKDAFFLTIRNSGRFSSLGIVSFLIGALGRGIIIALTGYFTFLVGRKGYMVENIIVFMVIACLIAFVIACLFLTIYEFSSLAILQCFLLEEEIGEGTTSTPDSLKQFLEMADEGKAKDQQKVKLAQDDNHNKSETSKPQKNTME